MNDLTRQCAEFPVEHGLRHKLAEGERESLAHMLLMPEHGLVGFIYPSIRANGDGKGRASIFGPGIAEEIHETFEEQTSPDARFEDLRMKQLSMAVVEPLKVVDIGWQGERFTFTGRFEATHPPYAFSMHPGGNPPYYGNNRTEQHGRLVADFTIDGKAYHHEGFLIRDHSWGPRVWGLNQHYKWFHATTGDVSIHVFEMLSFGRRLLRGFLWKDGRMSHVAEFDYDITYDDQMMHKAFVARIKDEDGRKVTVDSTALGNIQLDYDPMIWLNEAGLVLEIDGQPGVGWCEFCWNKNYYDFAKDYVTRFGR